MRAILGLLVVLSAGCAPVAPPDGRTEGSIEWTIGGDRRLAELAGGCLETPGVSIAVGGGTAEGGLTVVASGPTTELEWDATVEVETRQPVGGALVRMQHAGCSGHVATGAGLWRITWACDGVTGEAIITACERVE